MLGVGEQTGGSFFTVSDAMQACVMDSSVWNSVDELFLSKRDSQADACDQPLHPYTCASGKQPSPLVVLKYCTIVGE